MEPNRMSPERFQELHDLAYKKPYRVPVTFGLSMLKELLGEIKELNGDVYHLQERVGELEYILESPGYDPCKE